MYSGCVVRAAHRRFLAAAGALLAGLVLLPAVAGAAAQPAPDDLPQLWGVVVDGKALPALDAKVARKLRGAGAVVIADRGRLTAAQQRKLAGLTGAASVKLLEPLPAGDAAAAAAACAGVKVRRPGSRCGVLAPSAAAAKAISANAMTDLVVAPAAAPRSFAGMAAGGAAGRVVGVLGLAGGRYDAGRWRSAIAAANRNAALDLAVRPAGRKSRGALVRFLAQLRKQAGADRSAPAKPAPTVAALGADSVALAWGAASAKDGVTGYGLYRDGARTGATTGRSGSFGGLSCGAHVLEVDAVDRAGNRSAKSAVTAGPVGLRGAAAAADREPAGAAAPAGSATAAASAATTARHDRAVRPHRPPRDRHDAGDVTLALVGVDRRVGVTGYRVFRDGALVQTTTGTSLTVAGLDCATGYDFAVEAFDAAGNTSAKATLSAATAACPGPPPTGLEVTEATRTTLTLTWSPPARPATPSRTASTATARSLTRSRSPP